jgi:O-antigen ligase
VVAWSWVAAIILVVPLATLAYQSQLYLSQWLPHSAQHRIVIWGHTSSLIAKAPILGSGINTARALNDPDGYDAPLAPGSEFRLTTGLHSHNGYLQAWYETGAVGAFMLLAIGLLVLSSLARAPTEVQPYLYATFATCALLGGTSFSLWQPWFMASFGFAAGLAMLGWALADRSRVSACDSARS